MLQHLGNAELPVFGVAFALPQRSASQVLSSSKLPKRRCPASIQMRRRLSCTFFSTTPFSQQEATLQKSGSNR